MTLTRLSQNSFRRLFFTSRIRLQAQAEKQTTSETPTEPTKKLTFQKRKSMLEHHKLKKSLKKHDKDVRTAELKTKKEYIRFGKSLALLFGIAIGVLYELTLLFFDGGSGLNQTYYDFQVKKKAWINYGDVTRPVYEKRVKDYKESLKILELERKEQGLELSEDDIEEVQERIMRKTYK